MNAPTTLQSRVESYLAERRRLGFKLKSPGHLLMNFARYVDARNQPGPLTLEVMIAWARQNQRGPGTPITWGQRFLRLRPFIRYLRQFEPQTEMPDESIFGPAPGWQMPHIYHEQEIVDLLAAARSLPPFGGLRPHTYEALFGLIAAAGLRVSEALNLLDTDVDLEQGLLTVRQTKFTKSRLLPLHPTTVDALQRYRQVRNRYVLATANMLFFIGSRGRRLGCALSEKQVHRVFRQLCRQLGWKNRGAHDSPRIHDLRHTFAVRRVMLWHEHGTDIDQAMLALATYLGHAKISYTYWYLTAVPELMALAAGKFERFAQAQEVDHAP